MDLCWKSRFWVRIRFFYFFFANIWLTKVWVVKLHCNGAAHVTQVLELWHLVKFLGQADRAFQKKVVNFQLSDISDFAFWTPSFTNGKKIENFPQTTLTHHLVLVMMVLLAESEAIQRESGIFFQWQTSGVLRAATHAKSRCKDKIWPNLISAGTFKYKALT